MTDAIDIHAVTFYSPVSVTEYTPTVDLQGVEFAPADDRGVKLLFDRTQVNLRWPDFRVPGWTGDLQWTLFAGFQVNGQWQMGGFHEFWGSRGGAPREWTGAHPAVVVNGLVTHWQLNWAYDRKRFGDLCGVAPYEGLPMALMMVAGGARPGTSNHVTVAERSNIIVVPLRMSGREMARVEVPEPTPVPGPEPQPIPEPIPQPVPAPVPSVDFVALLERIAVACEANTQAQQDTLVALRALLEELS